MEDGVNDEYIKQNSRLSRLLKLAVLLLLMALLSWQPKLFVLSVSPVYLKELQIMTAVFLSILIEAIPFILLGVFVSALIHVFISEDEVARIIPKNRFSGILLAACMGIVFPVCECGIVPVVRRLMSKGMPQSMGISFLLAVPIINPVVMASTYFAFGSIRVALLRAILAFFVSVTVALLIVRVSPDRKTREISFLKSNGNPGAGYKYSCGCEYSYPQALHKDDHTNNLNHVNCHDYECDAKHNNRGTEYPQSMFQRPIFKKMRSSATDTLSYASDEFFQMGKFLIIGSFIAAVLQTTLSRDLLYRIGDMPVVSNLSMMGFGYALSLCSEADAFVAATFINSFSLSAILAFLVFGPMLDVKQTMMLLSTFKTSFVVRLTVAVTLLVSIFTIVLGYLLKLY